MPETASIVDELRAQFGAKVIDRAIANGIKAQKRYAARVASHGEEAAKQWLASQAMRGGCFWASEGGREVGVRRP